MWSALIKSAPDFLFELLETRAFYDPSSYNMIVATKFSWFGTRIMDVKYTTKAADSQSASVEAAGATEDAHASVQATATAATTTTTSSATSSGSSGASAELALDESIFNSAASNEFDNDLVNNTDTAPVPEDCNATGKFYVDAIPTQQKLEMSCNGTFLVYIYTNYLEEAMNKQLLLQQQQQQNNNNSNNNTQTSLPPTPRHLENFVPNNPANINKIFKLEFIYTSSDEKLIQEQPAAAASSSSAGGTSRR
jgi:hypothetical protein